MKTPESQIEQNGRAEGAKKAWQTPSVEAMNLMQTETGPTVSEDGFAAGS